jgi:hypothetical protein
MGPRFRVLPRSKYVLGQHEKGRAACRHLASPVSQQDMTAAKEDVSNFDWRHDCIDTRRRLRGKGTPTLAAQYVVSHLG